MGKLPDKIGKYNIVSLIATGGMGAVYRCRDIQLGREVALKRLTAGGAAGAAGIERFEREAQAVATLSHPNVVAIHDTGVHQPPGQGHDADASHAAPAIGKPLQEPPA